MSNEFFLPFKDTTRKRTSLYAVHTNNEIYIEKTRVLYRGRKKQGAREKVIQRETKSYDETERVRWK